MSVKRSSILFYFDNFHRVADLPDDQLGVLFRALMECGEKEVNGEDGITGFEERYPGMSEKTKMAFSFMADTIRRDAAAYAEKCGHRFAAQRRAEQRRENQVVPAGSSPAGKPPGDNLEYLVRRNEERRKKTGRPDWAAP